MGGREVGGMANLLSGHRDLANAGHRAEVAALWGVPEVSAKPGLTAVELFEAVGRGEIKALWIACTNPAQSLPDLNRVHAALAACPFVVVQEVSAATDTAAFADLLLPAAGWGEKEGTVTNSERRISRVRAAVPPPGEARADWKIAADFAQRLEARSRRWRHGDFQPHFAYAAPEEIFNEHRACFKPVQHRPTAEATDARLPLHLNSGRLRDHWHGMSRSGQVARLFAHTPEPVLEMHPRDMERRDIADGDLVTLKNKRGSLRLHAAVQVEKFATGWQLVALRRDDAGGLHAALQPWLARFDHATLTLAGRDSGEAQVRKLLRLLPAGAETDGSAARGPGQRLKQLRA